VEQLNRALDNPLPEAQRAALLGGLNEARSRMGTLVPTIDVEVGLPAEAPRQGTLFVIARPPGGGMPIAVVRRPAEALPLSVRLDDTASMSGLKLSDAKEIQVVVRLSRSGDPVAGPDDWEWRSGVLQPGALSDPLHLKADLAPRNAAGS
jgi:cytochrome c-type biogenesis protein CcmH